MGSKRPKVQPILLIGDAIAILFVISAGLRFHSNDEMLAGRLAVNFLPFLVAWFFAATAVGLLRSPYTTQWKELWRVLLAAALAAPLGAVLRGSWLGSPVLPIFVLVIWVALVIGLLIWRTIYIGLIVPRWITK